MPKSTKPESTPHDTLTAIAKVSLSFKEIIALSNSWLCSQDASPLDPTPSPSCGRIYANIYDSIGIVGLHTSAKSADEVANCMQ
jgi:hypothetical protein